MYRPKNEDLTVEHEIDDVIIIQDNFLSPDKKRPKVAYQRLSYSDKGKYKASMVSIIPGSSSVGAKTNPTYDRLNVVRRSSSNNVVDLTIPQVSTCSDGVLKPNVTKVYTRRNVKGPTLNTRMTPAAFHDELLKLNDAQKRAIREIRFGRILHLKVKDLPGGLGYWVLNKLNTVTCELEVDARRHIAVSENDVYRVFGFPGGKHSIKIFCHYDTLQRSLMVDYLRNLSEQNKARRVCKSKLKVVRMKWVDQTNLEDTGINLMWHLETFMGDNSAS